MYVLILIFIIFFVVRKMKAKKSAHILEQTQLKEAAALQAKQAEQAAALQAKKKEKMAETSEIICAIPQHAIVLSGEKRKMQNLDLVQQICHNRITAKGKYNCFVAIDTETTGLSVWRDKIVELSGVKFINGEAVEAWSTLINPGKSIPMEATEHNHITNEMVDNAPSLYEVLPDFEKWVGDADIVGHNLDFDLRFLCRSACTIFNSKRRYFDTLDICRYIVKDNLPNRKLGTVCEHYDIYNPDSHRSLSDAYCVGRLFISMVNDKQASSGKEN